MANICDFSMCVRGTKNDIESFYKALLQKGSTYMGRGADAQIEYEEDDNRAFIDGWCKWSINSALINNAISMRENPSRWYWGEGIDPSKIEFVTLIEACKKWNLDMEVYSEECGCCFQEHMVVINGELIVDDCVECNEYCICNYGTKEEAEAEFGIEITDEE